MGLLPAHAQLTEYPYTLVSNFTITDFNECQPTIGSGVIGATVSPVASGIVLRYTVTGSDSANRFLIRQPQPIPLQVQLPLMRPVQQVSNFKWILLLLCGLLMILYLSFGNLKIPVMVWILLLRP